MVSKTIYNSIVGAIAICIIVYYISRLNLFKRKTFEPMTSATDKDKISSAVHGNSDRLSDALLITKYRSNYEDVILSLEKSIGLSIVNEVINNAEIISKDAISPDSIKAIANINQLVSFRESLNQTMNIID
jgi:hypothetical protein